MSKLFIHCYWCDYNHSDSAATTDSEYVCNFHLIRICCSLYADTRRIQNKYYANEIARRVFNENY